MKAKVEKQSDRMRCQILKRLEVGKATKRDLQRACHASRSPEAFAVALAALLLADAIEQSGFTSRKQPVFALSQFKNCKRLGN